MRRLSNSTALALSLLQCWGTCGEPASDGSSQKVSQKGSARRSNLPCSI